MTVTLMKKKVRPKKPPNAFADERHDETRKSGGHVLSSSNHLMSFT